MLFSHFSSCKNPYPLVDLPRFPEISLYLDNNYLTPVVNPANIQENEEQNFPDIDPFPANGDANFLLFIP
jgi:hypothetical protein